MRRKIDDSRLEEFVSFMKERDIYLDRSYHKNGNTAIKKKFGISDATIHTYIIKAIDRGLFTTEERKNWHRDIGIRLKKLKMEKYGPDLFSQMMSDAWARGIGSDPDKLVSAARAGGLATQKNYPHVLENLTNAVPFGSNGSCYYGKLIFGSKDERLIGLVLQEYGLLKLENGITLQRNVGAKTVDFFINNKLIVEYHTITKEHSGIAEESEKEYLNGRIQGLRPYFKGTIVVLTKAKAYHFYEKLGELGIKDTYIGVQEKFRKIRDELKSYDNFMIDDFAPEPLPDEDVI